MDANHNAIVKALRAIPGCSAHSTAALGNGFPDVVAGYRGRNFLLEVKDGDKKPSARLMTDDERKFYKTWNGHVALVESVEEALREVLGLAV